MVLTFWPQTVTVGVGAQVAWSNPSFTDSLDVVFDDPSNVDSSASFYGAYSGSGNIPAWVNDTIDTSGIALQMKQAYINWFGADLAGLFTFIQGAQYRYRAFPVAGTYRYHSERYGATGTIVVR
jgi:hypothetical protein